MRIVIGRGNRRQVVNIPHGSTVNALPKQEREEGVNMMVNLMLSRKVKFGSLLTRKAA